MRRLSLLFKLTTSIFHVDWSPVLFEVISQRRAVLLSALSALAQPTASLAAIETSRKMQRVTIALVARPSLYQLPLTLADQLGYFRQAGVSVDWQAHESGAKALASAVQGQADVVSGAFEHLFTLHNKGLNYQAFVQMSRTPQVSLGIATRLDIRSAMAVKGLRIGVTALDSSTYWIACQWLLQNGLLPEDVSFVEVGSSNAVMDLLRNGVIDGLCNPDPVMHWLEQKNEIRVMAEARTLMSTRKIMGGPVPGACLFANAELLQRQPDAVRALTDAVVHALKWLQTAGLTDILKTVPAQHWLGDRAIYLGAFEKLRESYALDGLIAGDSVLNAWRAHTRLPNMVSGISNTRLALDRIYTNSFAEKSKNRFAA